MAADRSVADLAAAELPGSVQGIIAARLDGLDPEDKSLLQDAAVVGKTFWVGAVAAIGGARASRSRATAPRARTRAVRSPVAPFLGRRRDRIRVPASPRPRRGLRTDPARCAGGEAPRGGGLDRVPRRRSTGGPGGAARPPLPVRARADPCRRPRCDGVGGPGPARAASGGRPSERPGGVRRSRARLRGRGGPLASGRSRAAGAAAPLRPDPLARPRRGIGGVDRGEGRLPRVGPAGRGRGGGAPDRRPGVAARDGRGGADPHRAGDDARGRPPTDPRARRREVPPGSVLHGRRPPRRRDPDRPGGAGDRPGSRPRRAPGVRAELPRHGADQSRRHGRGVPRPRGGHRDRGAGQQPVAR